MGLTIEEMSIFEGAITVNGVYCNVRDITVTKLEEGYRLNFHTFFTVNDKRIDGKMIGKVYDEVPDEEVWSLCYSVLKEILTADGLNFTDA